MIVFAVILGMMGLGVGLIGGIFLYFYWDLRRKAALVGRVPTSTAAAVARLRPGELVEVQGTLRCKKPLISEMAGRPCAYFESRVERQFEEEERDADGDWRTVQRSRTVASSTRSTPFVVEDRTGRVRVNPEGAEVDAQEVIDRFEDSPPGGKVSLGGVVYHLDRGFRTLGYRFVERILPIDGPVYVLGAVTSDGAIGRPSGGRFGTDFIISWRSEEALVRSYGATDRWILWSGLGAFGGGALLVVIAVASWLIWG